MARRTSWLVVPVALSAEVLGYTARAEEAVPVAPAPSTSASTPPKRSLRRERPVETEIEVINLGGDRDPQAFAMGVQLGPGILYTGGSAPQAGFDMMLVADFGLGPGGKRVPWSFEPFLGFAITYNLLADTRGYPNRFTEIGARFVYRFDGGFLDGRWFSLGAGAVWTSRRPSSGYFHPSRACRKDDRTQAQSLGLDCANDDNIAPGALLDLGVGLFEEKVRRARWGLGLRVPVQLSATPGFAAFAVFYAQVGTAL